MSRNFETRFVIKGDADGGIRAIRTTDRELGQLNKGFEQGSRHSRTFARDVNSTSGQLRVLRRAAAPVGTLLAGMFAGRALQGQIDFANQLSDINTRLGVSTEALSEYAAIGKVAGVELNALTTAWQRQSRRISEAAHGTGVASGALKALNLNARELNQLAPEEQFERITQAMEGVADAGDRVRLAQQLWDSGGVQLLQIVNQGTDAIAAQREEFRRWGLTITDETAQAMAAHNAQMHRLTLMAQGVSRTMLAELVPSMTSGLESVVAFVDGVGGAEVVMGRAMNVAGAMAALYAGRMVGAMQASAAEKLRDARASQTQAQAELVATQQATRRAAAELQSARQLQARAVQEAKATAGTNAHTFALDNLTRANARLTQAQAAHTASTNAQTAAMQRASVVANGLRGALRMVGGPVGVAVLAASAMWMFRDSSDDVAASLADLEQPLDSVIEKFRAMNADLREAELLKWTRTVRSETESLSTAVRELQSDVLGATVSQQSAQDRPAFVEAMLEGFRDVKEGARTFDELLQWVLERADVDDHVIESWREQAGTISTGVETIQHGKGVIESLRDVQLEAAEAGDQLGGSIERNAPSDDAIQAWEKLNEQLRENIANLRDPSALGRASRQLDAAGILDPFRRATTLMLVAREEQLRDQQRLQKEAESASKRAAEEAQRNSRQILQAYERQAQGLSQQIALHGETGEAAKIRYEIEQGSLVALSSAQKQRLVDLGEELDALNKAKKGAEEYAQRNKSLIQQYDRHHQKIRELRQAVKDLNAAYADPDVEMSFAQYQRMLANIRDEMRQLALEAEPMSQEMARAWEEAANRIDETFADAFAGAFENFESFADQLMSGFNRLIAELMYQATLKPIVIGFTADMQGMLGIGGTQGGGFSNTIAGARSVWSGANQLGGLLGGGSAAAQAGTAAAGYAGTGFASQVATGGYTGWAGSAAAGSGAASAAGGWSSTASAAMPWVGAGLVADNVLGLGIVDGIVSGISRMFGGGSSTPASLRVATMAEGQMPSGQTGWEHHGSAYERGVFGDVGFAASGTQRLSKTLDGQHQEFLQAITAMDAMLASVASGEAQFNAMAEAARSVSVNGKTAEEVTNNLSERTLAAVRVIDGEYADMLAGLDLGAEALTARTVDAVQTLQSLSRNTERLGLQFDASASGALSAADALMMMAGGLDNLSALQSSYYQAYYSEAERAAHLQDDLSDSLAEMGMRLPDTRDGFRELVDAQDLNTEAGRETYYQLLQLAGGFDQLAQSMGDVSTAQEFSVQQLQLHGSGALASIRDAMDAYNGSLTTANDIAQTRQRQLQDEQRAVQQLGSLLDSLMLSSQSILAPLARMQEAQRQFAALQVRAESGDTSAVSEMRGAASSYLDAAAAYYGQSSSQYADIFGDVTGSVEHLRDEFGASTSTLGSIERVANDQLRVQERSRGTLIEQLQAQVDTLDGIHWISQLLDELPQGLASQLADIIGKETDRGTVLPDGEYVDDSGMTTLERQINDIYQDVLGRNADSAGLDYWLNDVMGGATLDDVRAAIEQNRLDGSHAGGLRNVPFDGYRAELHRGELVATADQAPSVRALLDGDLPMLAPVPMSLPQPAVVSGGDNRALLEELRKTNQRLQSMEAELTQLRAERGRDAERAQRQRDDQIDEQRRGNRHKRGATV